MTIYSYKLCIWWDIIDRYRQYRYCLGLIPLWGITWSRIIAVACFSKKNYFHRTPLTYIPVLSCKNLYGIGAKNSWSTLISYPLKSGIQQHPNTRTFQMWQQLLQQTWRDSLEERLAAETGDNPMSWREKLPSFFGQLVIQKENTTTTVQFLKNIACKWCNFLLSNLKRTIFCEKYRKCQEFTQPNNPLQAWSRDLVAHSISAHCSGLNFV